MDTKKIVLIFFAILGLVLLILGCVLGFKVFGDVVDDEIAKSVRLEQGTDQWNRFVQLPFPLKFNVYVFHVTNPTEVMAGGKPIVQEKGPYIYNQYRRKTNIEYKDNTVEYNQHMVHEFDKLASFPFTEEDVVTVLNVPLNSVFQIAEKEMSGLLPIVNSGWSNAFNKETSLFQEISVKDFFFGGYKFCDPATLNVIQGRLVCNNVRNKAKDSKNMVVQGDNSIVFSFFGFKNLQNDGNYSVGTGMEDAKDVGDIKLWNDMKYTSFWDGENSSCDEVRGTDSSIFPPYSDEETVYDVYSTDICRSVKLSYKRDMEYQGISGLRHEFPSDTFSSKVECFCTKKTKNLKGEDECFPDGFNDLYNCLNAPILLSSPHMLWADEEYSQTVEGMRPDEEKHVTFIETEPATGTPLRGAKRVQFNMVLRNIEKLDVTKDLLPSIMPVLWVDEGVELTDELVEELKTQYLNKLPVLEGIKWAMIVIGLLLFLFCAGYYLYLRRANQMSIE